jgi:hypothetical protein
MHSIHAATEAQYFALRVSTKSSPSRAFAFRRKNRPNMRREDGQVQREDRVLAIEVAMFGPCSTARMRAENRAISTFWGNRVILNMAVCNRA